MLVELHCHTYYSKGRKVLYDGVNSPGDIVRHAKKLGIGAINISDHDTIKGALEAKKLAKGILVITGEEVSSQQGHILAVGIQETVPKGLDLYETLDRIHQQGGIAIASHPFFGFKNYGLGELSKHCDAVEVFNSLNMDRISNRKCGNFVTKHGLPATAGSDAHCVEMLGHGLNRIEADNEDEVIKKIKKGEIKMVRKYIPLMIMQDFVVKRIQLSYDYTVKYMDNNYSWPKRALGKNFIKLVRKSPGRVDNVFKVMTYAFFCGSVLYMNVKGLTTFAGKY